MSAISDKNFVEFANGIEKIPSDKTLAKMATSIASQILKRNLNRCAHKNFSITIVSGTI